MLFFSSLARWRLILMSSALFMWPRFKNQGCLQRCKLEVNYQEPYTLSANFWNFSWFGRCVGRSNARAHKTDRVMTREKIFIECKAGELMARPIINLARRGSVENFPPFFSAYDRHFWKIGGKIEKENSLLIFHGNQA